MTREDIQAIALDLIDEAQRETPKDASAADLAYLMAYNDGVLAFLEKITFKMQDEERLQKEEATCEKAKLY